MSQVIELRDEVYTALKTRAEAEGVTPEAWIAARVNGNAANGAKDSPLKTPGARQLEKSIGAVDSSQSAVKTDDKELLSAKQIDKVFGDVVTEKMKRIGLIIPE